MTNQKNFPVILQILPALESGGVERGTIDLAKALKKDGFEPIVMSNGGVLLHQLREAGVLHIDLNVASKNPITIYRNIEKIVSVIKQHNIDIIHVRSRAPMWSAYFACKRTATKLVTTVHGTYSLKFFKCENFVLKRYYNAIMLKADRIIAVSNFIKNYLVQNYRFKKQELPIEILDKISVIQRGADLNYFNLEKVSKNRIINLVNAWNLPEDRKIIMLPARFTAWKGHEFLIEALTKVKTDFFCIFVGSDHGHEIFREKIEEKIVKSNLEGKVKIVGTCKDMPAAYAISHLVISASVRAEAFGRIAIEAQASNRIVIATKIGGSLETIIDGITGFLVEPNNSDELAKLIDKVLNFSEEETASFGKAARKHIEDNFSSQKMCASTIAIYKELLGK